MRAAAKLHRITIQFTGPAPDLNYSHLIAVFVAEELHDFFAPFYFSVRDLLPGHGRILEDALIDEFLNIAYLRGCKRGAAKIEGQLVRTDVGTFLCGFLANHFVERPMQRVRDGVVALDGVAARGIDRETDCRRGGRRIL